MTEMSSVVIFISWKSLLKGKIKTRGQELQSNIINTTKSLMMLKKKSEKKKVQTKKGICKSNKNLN